MEVQSSKIECPECGCREIHREYDSSHFFSRLCRQSDESIFDEGMWCYCLNCGVMFDPVQEAFSV